MKFQFTKNISAFYYLFFLLFVLWLYYLQHEASEIFNEAEKSIRAALLFF